MGEGEVVALIAGAGRLPVILAEAVKARGMPLLTVTVEGDGVALGQIADVAYRAGVGEIDRILAILKSHRVRRVMMAGQVPRVRMVTADPSLQPWLAAASDRRDQAVFQEVVVKLLAQHGMAVVSPLEFISHLVAGAGVLSAVSPTADQWDDIRFGVRIARAVADLDIGQTVVVKHGVILAVEAAEGTDATVRRAGDMMEDTVVVKVARPSQDDRFDLPAVGLETVHSLIAARAAVLAIEAGRTLFLDRGASLTAAGRAGIAIIGVELPGSGVRGPGSGP